MSEQPLTIVTQLKKEIRSAANYNQNVQQPPACILWPDGDRQFESVVDRLLSEIPELCVLGKYAPDKRTGPAIWLRLVVADKADGVDIPAGQTPILYLPGVRRQDLRAVENCPDALKPLAELQYRGTIWSQVNAKDWTILAFLQSHQGGLGLDVAADKDAKHAMRLSLYRLLDEQLNVLNGQHLDRDYFNSLLTSGDTTDEILLWIDDPQEFRSKADENAWRGFVEICKSQFKLDPEQDGELEAAQRLAEKSGPWELVWNRFAKGPTRYPNLPAQLRKTKPITGGLFPDLSGWPQANDDAEALLRTELLQFGALTPEAARSRLLQLDESHHERRSGVWAELGDAPLAVAMEHLVTLANVTTSSLAAGNAADMQAAYRTSGWQADDAMLRALAAIASDADLTAVTAVLNTVYVPWANDAARHLQKVVHADGYPRRQDDEKTEKEFSDGTCFMFIDGLRFDVAMRLQEQLEARGVTLASEVTWAALPSVTSTAKPAVTPVRHLVTGQDVNSDFTASVAETGESLTSHRFQKLLEQCGWQKLGKTENGDPDGRAWCEMGDIDHEGHERGWKLARHIDALIKEAAERVEQLLAAGWKSIRIVTDHGWLLMPGGLPQSKLDASLSDNKWGRCAALKSGSSTSERQYPWHWNPTQSFALPDGIKCYRKREYSHGGISLQECVNLMLTATGSTGKTASSVTIESIEWQGLRCRVSLSGSVDDLELDIRTLAGDPSSSKTNRKVFKSGKAAALVTDDNLEGHAAFVVVTDNQGTLIAQQITVIGGD